MLPWLFVLALGVSPEAAQGSDLEATVIVYRLPSRELIEGWCRAPWARVHACTHFVGYSLRTECIESEGSWSLQPSARYKALVSVFNADFLGHEYAHTQDMERQVREHLQEMRSERFPSLEGCREAGRSAASEFPRRMREIAKESNDRRR